MFSSEVSSSRILPSSRRFSSSVNRRPSRRRRPSQLRSRRASPLTKTILPRVVDRDESFPHGVEDLVVEDPHARHAVGEQRGEPGDEVKAEARLDQPRDDLVPAHVDVADELRVDEGWSHPEVRRDRVGERHEGRARRSRCWRGPARLSRRSASWPTGSRRSRGRRSPCRRRRPSCRRASSRGRRRARSAFGRRARGSGPGDSGRAAGTPPRAPRRRSGASKPRSSSGSPRP